MNKSNRAREVMLVKMADEGATKILSFIKALRILAKKNCQNQLVHDFGN